MLHTLVPVSVNQCVCVEVNHKFQLNHFRLNNVLRNGMIQMYVIGCCRKTMISANCQTNGGFQ
jgi:hypothetical protein